MKTKTAKRILIGTVVMLILSTLTVGTHISASSEEASPIATSAVEGTHELIPKIARGSSIPTSTWNIANKGSYSFQGYSTTYNDLYTEYRFSGCSSYDITVKNHFDSNLVVTVCRAADGKVLNSYTFPGNSETSFTLNVSNMWYLEFGAPCDVTGTISAAE
ncbi:MAG: hypothetical protein HFE63_03590 [Clostridiales bacterium]|nr:hypothetical protein [Clostridiales bacterium]